MKNNKILALIVILLISFSMVACLDVSKAQVVNPVGIDSGLVGYWRFDDDLGNVAVDSSGNSNNVVVSGANWVSGKYNSALNFSVNSDYAKILDNVVFDSFNTTGAFTLSCWVNLFSLTSVGWFFVSRSGTFDIEINMNSGGRVYCYVVDGRGLNCYATKTFSTLNTWCNFVFVGNTSSQYPSIYLNGVLLSGGVSYGGSGDLRTGLSLNSGSIDVGSRDDVSNYNINGTIDDLRLYNRTLSVSEISTLYNGLSVSVTHDLGSTVSPNGTVYVGVDQTQNFILNSISGYTAWSYYVDGIPYASASVIGIGVQNTNRTLYVTSQYIGGFTITPTPYPTAIPSSGSIANYFTNFPSEIQFMLVGVIAVFFIITAFVLFARKRRRF